LEKADTRYSKVSASVGPDTFFENDADTDTSDTFLKNFQKSKNQQKNVKIHKYKSNLDF
jgi:hypothetical protein